MYELRKQNEKQGINYDWYIEEAQSIVRELKNETVSRHYIKEKIRNVLKAFDNIEESE